MYDFCVYPYDCDCWMCVSCGRATIITKEEKVQDVDSKYCTSQAFIKSWMWDQDIGTVALFMCLTYRLFFSCFGHLLSIRVNTCPL